MAKVFKFEIITPGKVIFEGNVTSVLVPCESGYREFLAGHVPLVANTVAGKVVLKSELGEKIVISSEQNGFFEVLKNKAHLFLDSF